MRRIGVLMNTMANTEQQQSLMAFQQALQQLGWTEGRNVQMEVRWAGGDAREIRRHAGELVAPAPDVIVATGNAGMVPLLQATRIIPIVFNNVADPVGGGFVKSMARPGGNATGFIQFEYSCRRLGRRKLKKKASEYACPRPPIDSRPSWRSAPMSRPGSSPHNTKRPSYPGQFDARAKRSN